MKERSGNHWLVWLAMCGMIGATLGVKNTSGVFFTPMAERFGVKRPALVTKDVFGAERYRAVFPAVTLAGTVANASAASLIGFLYDAAGSYHPAMLLLIALLGAISLLLLFLYRNRRKI